MRIATQSRKTAETDITVEINLDGTGIYDNQTGIGFFDHMLDQLSRHALIDMKVRAIGDLPICTLMTTTPWKMWALRWEKRWCKRLGINVALTGMANVICQWMTPWFGQRLICRGGPIWYGMSR